MAMVPFYSRSHLRNLAIQETRSATVHGWPDLPDGEYGFFEFYCDEPGCNCQRVLIQVISPTTGAQVWATINYGWESVEFYKKRGLDEELARECQEATLDPLNPQTKYSSALLQLFKSVLQDQAYVERLKRHYKLFKADLGKQHRSTVRTRKRPKRSRK